MPHNFFSNKYDFIKGVLLANLTCAIYNEITIVFLYIMTTQMFNIVTNVWMCIIYVTMMPNKSLLISSPIWTLELKVRCYAWVSRIRVGVSFCFNLNIKQEALCNVGEDAFFLNKK